MLSLRIIAQEIDFQMNWIGFMFIFQIYFFFHPKFAIFIHIRQKKNRMQNSDE